MECGGIGVRCRYLVENKLKADKPKYDAKESPPPRGDDFIVKHTYTVSPKTDSMEQVKPKEDGETVKESEVTFEDDKLPKSQLAYQMTNWTRHLLTHASRMLV